MKINWLKINWLKIKYFLFGYIRISNALSVEQVSSLRFALNKLTHNKNEFIYADSFYKNNLHNFFLGKKIIDKCQIIFESDFLFSNGGVVQHDNYGIYATKNSLLAGVHIDSDFQFFLKDKYLTNFSYNFAKLGIYLQNSSEKNNVLVLPGSHIIARLFGKLHINKLFLCVLKAAQILLIFRFVQSMCRPKIQEGDALIFDCLLIHSSDFASKGKSKKYVLYTEVGNRKSMINFIDNNVKPRARIELENNEINKAYSRDPNRYNKQIFLSKSLPKYITQKQLKFFYSE